jgi:ParB-like chromosome segregation protein Spo0J
LVRKIALAFHPDAFYLSIERILPLRTVPPHVRTSQKYKCILATLKEVGLIEPLIVYPQRAQPKLFLLLDGTLRFDMLKEMGETEVLCLRATDDEAVTYNHKVNQLSPIQEHFMIMQTLRNGVSDDRIAAALHVDVAAIRRKCDLLVGICPEAVELLRDRRISPAALREVKRVLPLRQVEMAELMIGFNNFSASYAKCLYAGTPSEEKIAEDVPPDDRGLSGEDTARMQRETASLHREIKLIEESHGETVLNLVPAVGYLRKVLANSRVIKYLQSHHAEILVELRKIIDEPDLRLGQ